MMTEGTQVGAASGEMGLSDLMWILLEDRKRQEEQLAKERAHCKEAAKQHASQMQE